MKLVSGPMRPAPVHAAHRLLLPALTAAGILCSGQAMAAGTAAGTVIDNAAQVSFDISGTNVVLDSNTVSVTVDERIDVLVVLQSPQIQVNANDADRSLLFTVTNTGNGSEEFQIAIDSNLAGDDFDPVPAVTSIYFDTDSSGDYNAGDVAYAPGGNDPVLAADAAVNMLLVNDIPGTVNNAEVGRSQLQATAATGSGSPGDLFAGLGDGGVDAVIGASGGIAAEFGEYVVADVQINIVKSVAIADPFGGTSPVPGATLTYSITVEVLTAGTASGAVFSDVIPTFTSFVASSISLNGVSLTDSADADAGELDSGGAATVNVRLGDLTQADPVQTVTFQVTID